MFTIFAVNVRRTLLDFSTTNGMDIREKMSHKFGFFGFSLVGGRPCLAAASRRPRDEAVRMVVNVAGGAD